jgi:hypothetical protein
VQNAAEKMCLGTADEIVLGLSHRYYWHIAPVLILALYTHSNIFDLFPSIKVSAVLNTCISPSHGRQTWQNNMPDCLSVRLPCYIAFDTGKQASPVLSFELYLQLYNLVIIIQKDTFNYYASRICEHHSSGIATLHAFPEDKFAVCMPLQVQSADRRRTIPKELFGSMSPDPFHPGRTLFAMCGRLSTTLIEQMVIC